MKYPSLGLEDPNFSTLKDNPFVSTISSMYLRLTSNRENVELVLRF